VGQLHRSEEVDLHLMTQLGQRGFLDDALVSVARVVHEDVDMPEIALHAGDEARDRGGVGQLEAPSEGSPGRESLELGEGLVASDGTDYTVPCR
jgi:hypothetical protein